MKRLLVVSIISLLAKPALSIGIGTDATRISRMDTGIAGTALTGSVWMTDFTRGISILITDTITIPTTITRTSNRLIKVTPLNKRIRTSLRSRLILHNWVIIMEQLMAFSARTRAAPWRVIKSIVVS